MTESTHITADTMLPDLIAQYPRVRTIFDRYGLSGCGGSLGPHESIAFFARTHGVDEASLIAEIQAATATATTLSEPVPAGEMPPSIADTIYRRFFMTGIAIVLTAGASWGAWLLWQIGIKKEFTGISVYQINAHGHAQIFGWVGLFIMGFAYQAFPRLWHTRLAAPRLAVFAFVAMAVGIILRTTGMAIPEAGWALTATVSGGVLELAAIATFAIQLIVTFRASQARLEPYVAFAFAAAGFFILQAALSLWHAHQTMTAPGQDALIAQIATWQAPLRDIQIHGLALLMILGVNLRMLPALFDVPKIADRRAWTAFGLLLTAIIGEVTLFLAYRMTGNHGLAALLMVPWLMLVAGCATIALPWKLWRPLRTFDGSPDRSAKFIRMAWGWLAISFAMLLLLPVHRALSGIAFSHAYYGAIRHAITVGFISLMIMGFAAKVVPMLAGVDPRKLQNLWIPFWLLNIGCALRVSTQTLTDVHPGFFAVIGVSGTLEVTGLAIWGVHLGRIMVKSHQTGRESWSAGPAPAFIASAHSPAQVLDWFPPTLQVFETYGFAKLNNPVLRKTIARRVTMAQVASMHDVNLERLLIDLNKAVGN